MSKKTKIRKFENSKKISNFFYVFQTRLPDQCCARNRGPIRIARRTRENPVQKSSSKKERKHSILSHAVVVFSAILMWKEREGSESEVK